MGKETGFLEVDREDRGYEDPRKRLKTYKEFVIPLPEDKLRMQASRCMNCGIPYCHNGCPVNNQIPDWNDLVYKGGWQEAVENLLSTNNFPEFTGRICPAPCEAACTLNIIDQPVTIKTIEAALADRGWKEGWIKPQPPEEKTGKSVAVVGSGPAGLSAAHRLAMLGHDVTIFEAKDKLGGLNEYGIAAYKTVNDFAQREVDWLLKIGGITPKMKTALGRDITLENLRRDYDAEGIVSCKGIGELPDGAPAACAGVVLVRQRPGEGKAIFITLSDETGVCNVVVWARTFEHFRKEVMGSRLLLVEGRVQKSPEGVVHLMAENMVDRSADLRRLSGAAVPRQDATQRHPSNVRVLPPSRDFH